jgi:MutS domain I
MNRLISNSADVDTSTLAPAAKKYLDAKKEFPHRIVFVEVGDFFETFFEDAKTVSKELDLILMSKSSGSDRIAMAGVPAHAIERYDRQLWEKGIKCHFPLMQGTYTDGEYVYEVSNSWVIGMTKNGVIVSFDAFTASRFWKKIFS